MEQATDGAEATEAASERFRDKELIYKALYKFAFFTLLYFTDEAETAAIDLFRRDLKTFLFHSVYGHQDTD